MLGIVVALPWELKSLTRQAISVGTCKALRDNTLVVLSGIGAARAYAAGALLVSEGATALLGWGFAAGLDDRLAAGSLLLPERIIDVTGESHPVSAEWHQRLHQTLSARYPVRTDALVESNAIVKTSVEKRDLARRTRAVATDMESAAQARFALERRLPFAVVRAVIDTASSDIPQNVMRSLDPQGNVNVEKFLGKAVFYPADWIKMVKLGMQFNAARRTLKKTSGLVMDASQTYLNGASPDALSLSRE